VEGAGGGSECHIKRAMLESTAFTLEENSEDNEYLDVIDEGREHRPPIREKKGGLNNRTGNMNA